MPLTKFVDRVPQQPNRKKIKFETNSIDLENGNYATVEYADNPTTVGTPLSAANLNQIVDAVNDLEKVKRVLLFQGAIKTGDITLNDNMYNYRFLYIKVSASTEGYTYGGGIYPIIDPTLNNSYQKTQSFMGYEVPSESNESSPNAVNTYSGIFVNKNETTLTVVKQIGNVSHQSGKNHGGGTKYYVREIFGIR